MAYDILKIFLNREDVSGLLYDIFYYFDAKAILPSFLASITIETIPSFVGEFLVSNLNEEFLIISNKSLTSFFLHFRKISRGVSNVFK